MRRRLWPWLAVAAAATLVLLASFEWRATLDALAEFRWWLVPPILGCVLVNYGLRFFKWHYYLRRLAVPLPAGPSLMVFLAGFTMAITPGKLGELVKAVLVRDLTGTDVSRTAAVVVAERLTDVAGLLILAGLGVTVLPHGHVFLSGLSLCLVLLIALLRSPVLLQRGLAALTRVARLARLAGSVQLFLRGGRELLGAGTLVLAVSLSAASWFFECLALHLVLAGLGVVAPLRGATFVYAFSSLAGAVSMLPGGLGVAEASLAGLLAMLGVALPKAAAATLLIRVATLWLAVALGMATMALAFPRTAPLARDPSRR